MLPAIDFNYQSLFETDEVDNVGSKWMLAAEAMSGDLLSTKQAPETAFGVG